MKEKTEEFPEILKWILVTIGFTVVGEIVYASLEGTKQGCWDLE